MAQARSETVPHGLPSSLKALPADHRDLITSGWSEANLLAYVDAELLLGKRPSPATLEVEVQLLQAKLSAVLEEKERIESNLGRLGQAAQIAERCLRVGTEVANLSRIRHRLKRRLPLIFGTRHSEIFLEIVGIKNALEEQLRTHGVRNKWDLDVQLAFWRIQGLRLPALRREIDSTVEPLQVITRALEAHQEEGQPKPGR